MTRLLITSDWQIDFSNLQECEQSLQELLTAAAKYKPAAIVNLGDVKQSYSPVDLVVTKFAVSMVRRIRRAGFRFIVLKGNHDRASQAPDAQDWMSVLQAAGAEVVTRPRVIEVAGVALGCLPFVPVPADLIEAATGLQRATAGHSGPRLLLFHAEVVGALMGGSRLTRGPSPEDLHFDHYNACFGGHIHQRQSFADNAEYIGSPFCHDWGEVNSRKGHVLVTIKEDREWMASTDPNPRRHEIKVSHLITSIPHWYDAAYLATAGIKPEDGAYVRSKVQVSSKRVTDQLLEEEQRLLALYGPKVRFHIVPELLGAESDEVILKGTTDREKIEQYVTVTLPEASRFEAAQAVAYLASRLEDWHVAAGSSVRFTGVEATNALILKEAKFGLSKLGLVLIRGESDDRRSNGSGKSSVLSLIPLAMFGQTPLKEQRHNAWAFERNDDSATVILRLRDAAGRRVEIERGARPFFLRVKVDGADQSAGITGKGRGREETQGRIEEITGYDMRTLMNAVYIDQSVASGFMFGTNKDRMDLIGRFLDLARFDTAQKLVGQDISAADRQLAELAERIESLNGTADDLDMQIASLKQQTTAKWSGQLTETKLHLEKLIEQHAAIMGVVRTYEELQSEIDDMNSERSEEQRAVMEAQAASKLAVQARAQANMLVNKGVCPTCTQPTKKIGPQLVKAGEEAVRRADAAYDKHSRAQATLNGKIVDAEKRMRTFAKSKDEVEDQIEECRRDIRHLTEAATDEAERNKRLHDDVARLEQELSITRYYARAALSAHKTLSIDREMLEYARKAFQRGGIPLYMAMSLCPLLNKAAADYSEVFTDGRLQVTFAVEDGEFAVGVVNPSGSGTVEGQSVGERAMVGLICAFALREAAPKTNLLVMDEPGAGLDPEGCRAFARGIMRLKERFESILLVTHSPYVLSTLSGERVWVVEKRRGRSRLRLG